MMSEGSGNKRCYVDNAMNRRLGRAGMPLGSMVVSSRGNSSSPFYVSNDVLPLSDSSRGYVDNYMNHEPGRVGMPFGSIVVSNRGHSASLYDYSDICLPLSDSKRAYVEDYMNRGLGRIGMPLRSMVVSREKSSAPLQRYSNAITFSEAKAILENTMQQIRNSLRDESKPTSNSCHELPAPSKTDNEYNQGLEGVNRSAACCMTESSRERSSSPSSAYSRESSSTGTKHDVAELTNKSFEPVDLPYGANIKDENVYEEKPWHGKLVHYCKGKSPPSPVSSRESSASAPNDTFGSYNSSSRKKYVENALNRNHGRVDMPNGSKPVSKSKSRSSSSSKTYWDNEYKRRLERMRAEHGSLVVSKDTESGRFSEIKHYVDNSANGSLGRVGLPNEVCKKKVYEDNSFNKMLGRVGLPIGTEGMPGSREGSVRTFFTRQTLFT